MRSERTYEDVLRQIHTSGGDTGRCAAIDDGHADLRWRFSANDALAAELDD